MTSNDSIHNWGFVYIFSNPSMPGMLKIGTTIKHPLERAGALYSTGVATPFKVEFAIWVEDAKITESDLHKELYSHRVNDSREFFKIKLSEAIERVINHSIEGSLLTSIDFTIDPGNYALYCHLCGCAPPDLPQVIDCFTPEDWFIAYCRLQRLRKDRKPKLISHTKNTLDEEMRFEH